MANPRTFSPIKPHFFQPLLPGFHLHLNIPVTFFKKHIEGSDENKRVTLNSDVSNRRWEVKLDGRRFTDGWKDFADDHGFRIGDFVVFRHEGDLVFHVTAFGPSCCNLQYALFSIDDDDREDNSTRNVSRVNSAGKIQKTEDRSSSDSSCFTSFVTVADITSDQMNLPVNFVRSNGLRQKQGEIVLIDERGRSWSLDLRRRRNPSGRIYIRRGWRSFCNENGLKPGVLFTFKLVRNGTTPVLRLSPPEESSGAMKEKSRARNRNNKGETTSEGCPKNKERVPSSPRPNPFVTLALKPYTLTKGLRLPLRFTRENGIEKPRKVTLLDKNGVEWPIDCFFEKRDETIRLGIGGLRGFFGANGVKEGESFTLELIGRDTTPVLKFRSKIRHGIESMAKPYRPKEVQWQKPEVDKTRTRKKVRIGGLIPDPTREKRSKREEHGSMGVPSSIRAEENSRRAQSCSDSDESDEAKRTALDILGEFPDVLGKEEEEDPLASLRKLDTFGNLPRKKKVKCGLKAGAESSSDRSCFVASVTASNLRTDTLFLPTSFTRSAGLNDRCCEIVLMDGRGRSWASDLRIKKLPGRVCVSRGWRSFCRANGLRAGDSCTVELVQNGTKPVLRLSPGECPETTKVEKGRSEKQSSNEKSRSGECSNTKKKKARSIQSASPSPGPNPYVTLTPKNFRGYMRLPKTFTRENGIDKSGSMALLDKNGVEWPTNYWMEKKTRRMHLGEGSGAFLRANGVKKDGSFVLKLIWKDETPKLEFFSETHRSGESLVRKNIQTRKRVRDGGPVLDPAREKRSKRQEKGPKGASLSARGTAETSRRSQSDRVVKAEQTVPEVVVIEEQNLGAFGKILRKKSTNGNRKGEAEPSGDRSCFVARVTAANLREDKLALRDTCGGRAGKIVAVELEEPER